MGESYAGVYIPTLASLLLDGQREFPINLKVKFQKKFMKNMNFRELQLATAHLTMPTAAIWQA